ncbi:MAG TPA: hypothetical protein VEC11_06185 [Allosphingosinicella sp.]|nr:hypothetical protein [Allosphingosinicella sp.]
MRLPTSLILLAALAGCGSSGQQPGNAAVNAAAPPGPAAPANALATPAPAAADAAGLAAFRQDAMRGCVEGGRETAPPGTPVDRHCACAVDRVMAGRTLAQLEAEERSGDYESRFQGTMSACIAETGG